MLKRIVKNSWFLSQRITGVQRHAIVCLCLVGDTLITANSIILSHDYSIPYGIRSIFTEKNYEIAFRKEIKIGRDVFIGRSFIVLPKVSVGDNCIIGLASLVNKDVLPISVYDGAPSKYICSVTEFYVYTMNKNSENIG